MDKPRILLCWAYHRRHFVNIFNKLENDFEFVYLNWLSKELEMDSFTNAKRIYWLDFKNIQQLVNDINPSKVIFMGMEGFATILNEYCKKRNIPTYYLQHGVFHSYNAYVQEELLERKKLNIVRVKKKYKKVSSILKVRFLISSFSFELLNSFYTLLRVAVLTKLFRSRNKAYNFTQSNSRQADKYIVYTKYCSLVLAERDGINDKKIIEVGNPEADEILIQMEHEFEPLMPDEYYLLIDDPIAEAQDSNGLFSIDMIKEFHSKLNKYAFEMKKKLVIKLHPDNYGSTWLYKDDNIIYMRDSNIANLIKYCSGIFGGASTLLAPAILNKPACLFKYNDDYIFQKFVSAKNYCTVLNFFNFHHTEISFKNEVSPEQRSEYIDAFLFKDDKKSLLRIKSILEKVFVE